MTSFQCKQCITCNQWRTVQELFTHSDTTCDKCFIEPPQKIKKEAKWPKRSDRLWTMYNRKNPKAKQLYKQSLISNS